MGSHNIEKFTCINYYLQKKSKCSLPWHKHFLNKTCFTNCKTAESLKNHLMLNHKVLKGDLTEDLANHECLVKSCQQDIWKAHALYTMYGVNNGKNVSKIQISMNTPSVRC